MGKESMKEQLGVSEPPINWYYGTGRIVSGIGVVTTSKEFNDIENGELGRQLGAWRHFTSNPTDKRDSEENERRSAGVLQEAKQFVEGLTGFTPQEIIAKADSLLRKYQGKNSAPFPFELF